MLDFKDILTFAFLCFLSNVEIINVLPLQFGIV